MRINGKGKSLNQADFIMTLMSVFWDEGRAELEAFARAATRPSDGQASPFNQFIKPSPDQLLRATVGDCPSSELGWRTFMARCAGAMPKPDLTILSDVTRSSR